VSEDRVTGVQCEPEVLAPAAGGGQGAPGEPADHVGGPGQVPAHGPQVQHLGGRDLAPDHVLGQATADDLDLG